ncbi:MAG: NAD(P)-dependent oxidoreductase [Patescibacteria group bacterium]
MKVLITGGAGFLGLHLAKYFGKKGWELYLLDIQPFDTKEYPRKSVFIKADIRNAKAMQQHSKGIDLVIHAAAALPLWKKEAIYSTNIDGTKNVLENALSQKVKHVIYISSTAVYGIPRKHPVYEGDSLVGVGPYGESKIAAEQLCESYRKKGLLVTVIRPKTFVGTYRLGVFEILFDWIKDGKRIPVVGSGNNKYQLLDVDDLVEAVHLCFKTGGRKVNDNFNIGAAQFGTVKQDLNKLFQNARSGSTIFPTPAMPLKLVLRFLEMFHLSPLYQWVYETADKDSFVSIEHLSKTIKWKPRYSNAQALIKSYQWYLDHYDEVKSHKSGVTHRVGWNQGILKLFKKFL